MEKIYISAKRLKQVMIAFVIMAAGIAGYTYFKQGDMVFVQAEESEEYSVEKETSVRVEELSLLGVHVTGAVVNADQVVYLPEGSRVADALAAVGGPLEEADLSQLNLAGYIADGQRIRVPFIGETTDISRTENNPPENSEKLLTNINLATKIELLSLPGIGESYAERIIAYRETNGPFATIEDIKKVKGIGEAKFAELKDRITVD